MKNSPASPTTIALLLKTVEHERHLRIPFTINDEPTPTIVALRNRGLIETWQDGPSGRARLTASGYAVLAAAR